MVKFLLFFTMLLISIVTFSQTGYLVSEGKTATSSSIEPGNDASNANDGNLVTRWASLWTANEWWQVDLSSPMSISSVVIEWQAAAATAYNIQISNDPTFATYSNIATVTAGDGGEDIVLTDNTKTGRYLRMQGITRSNPIYGYSMFEFKAYSLNAPPMAKVELKIPFNAQYYSLAISPADKNGINKIITQNVSTDSMLYFTPGTSVTFSTIESRGDYDIQYDTKDAQNNPVSSFIGPLTVNVYDGMVIQVSYIPRINTKNKQPNADAGVDIYITEPANSVTLNGSKSNDPDGIITKYLWTQLSGPTTATLSATAIPIITASDLVLGTYVFQLSVTDDSSSTVTDNVSVIVQKKIVADFYLTTPINNAMVTDTRKPTFTWDAVAGATNYDIYVNISRTDYDWFASGNLLDRYTKVGSSATNSYTLTTDLVDRWTYKWYIVATTAGGIKTSNILQFGLYIPYLEQADDGVSIVNGCRDMNKNGTIEPFEDWHLTPDQRLDDMMARMTLPEIASQLFYGGETNPLDGFCLSFGQEAGMTTDQYASAKTRMGIPVAFTGDKVHGWKTIYPTQLGMAAMRDMNMVYKCGNIQRVEHKAFGFTGTLSPLAEVDTKVLYPRFQEGCGENADEAAANVRAIITGMQGGPELNPHSMLVTVKHWPSQGAGGENALQYDAITIKYHMKTWHAAIDVNCASIMPGYNRAPYLDPDNGANSSKKVIDYLRKDINFKGFIVTDWLGASTAQSTESLGVGVDVMGGAASSATDFNQLVTNIGMDRINEACRRVLNAKLRMGLFENPYGDPTAVYTLPENHAIVLEAAKKSYTLLANNGILPLKLNAGDNIVVGGPRATWPGQDFDPNCIWQSIYYADTQAKTYYQAIKDRATGINVVMDSSTNTKVAIVIIGEASYTHASDWPGTNPELPAAQIAVLKAFKDKGIPVVCGIILPRPYVLTPIIPYCDAIIALYRPGTGAGQAFAQLIFGDYQPSGKLPFQLPRSIDQIGTDVPTNQLEKWDLPYDLGATDAERTEMRSYIANDQPVPTNYGNPLFPYGYGFTGFSFTDATNPVAFNLVSPANNANVQLGTVTLNWTLSSDPETNINHYEVWLDGKYYADAKGGSYTLPTSIPEGIHTWYVVAENWAKGRTQSTQTFTFTMKDTEGPLAFNLLTPANGLSVTGTTIPLIWESTSDAGKGMDHYELYVDNVFVKNFQPTEVQPARNIALGATITTSSNQNAGMAGSFAVDSSNTTRWASNTTDNESITINLGAVQKITSVQILWENAYGKEYKIQFSNDGINWKDIINETNGHAGEIAYDSINLSARYVKMQGVTRGSAYGYSIFEFRVFGPESMSYNATGLALGDHTWYVKALDKAGNSTKSTVAPSKFTIYQTGTDLPPYADAGLNQTIMIPISSTQLNASNSYDPEGKVVTYSWSQKSGPNTATFDSKLIAEPKISGLVLGNYVFVVTVSDGVKTATAEVTVTVDNTTNISIATMEGISVFPNPAYDVFTISGGLAISEISIINIAGDIMYKEKPSDKKEITINCSNFPSGVYFVKIIHSNGVLTSKIVKE